MGKVHFAKERMDYFGYFYFVNSQVKLQKEAMDDIKIDCAFTPNKVGDKCLLTY